MAHSISQMSLRCLQLPDHSAPGDPPATTSIRYIRDSANGSSGNTTSYWVEIKALNASGTNVASGKTVTATGGTGSSNLTNITDDNTDTENYGSITGSSVRSVTVDLGAATDIASITVWHYYGDGRTFLDTKTEVSADGTTWITLHDASVHGTYAETAAGVTYEAPFVATSPVRYIRDWLAGSAPFNGNGTSYWVEIQAYNNEGTNVALSKSVSANFAGSLTLITDGVTDTESYIGTGAAGSFYVVVDLGAIINIASITRWHYYGDSRVFQGTKTEVSQDGTSWDTIFDSATAGTYTESAGGKTDSAVFVPSTEYTVSMSDFGGGPSATLAANRTAFTNALADIAANGGGVLQFDAGTYAFGNQSGNPNIFTASSPSNVRIVGTGVTLSMNTTDTTTPKFFNISNPTNVTIEDFTFTDSGAVITGSSANRGAQCIYIPVSATCSGFKALNCTANNVNIFCNYDGTSPYTRMTNTEISGCSVTTAYYGLLCSEGFGSSNASRSTVQMTCEGVRRAINGRGANNMNINITGIGVSTLGSNGFIYPHPHDDKQVQNVAITLTLSGNCSSYQAMVHLGHQTGSTNSQAMTNIDVTLAINSVSGSPSLVRFSHEPNGAGTILSSSPAVWNDVVIGGSISGSFAGSPIGVLTTSTSPGNSVLVSTTIRSNVSGLPSYFQSFTP